MDRWVVFDASVARPNESETGPKAGGTNLSPTLGKTEILHVGIIGSNKDQVFISRLLRDGSEATDPGFREVKDKADALAEAAAGKLVLWLHNDA